jgi:hypothetical protein
VACVLGLLVAMLPGPGRAGEATTRRFLVEIDGVHVGWATWTWAGTGYRETLRIAARQGAGRATIESGFTFSAQPDGALFERRVRAGTVDRRERGRIVDGSVMRLRDGNEVAQPGPRLDADAVLPPARIASLRALAFAAGSGARVAFDADGLRARAYTYAPCAATAEARCVAWRAPGRGEERWLFAGDGTLQRVESVFAGLPLALVACGEDCDRPVAAPLDVIGQWTVASPVRIPRTAAHDTLRYVFARDDGAAPVLARTDEQAVVADGARAVVTVCATCGGAAAETADTLAPYLRRNAWVQSDAVAIRRLANQAAGAAHDVHAQMPKLVAAVRRRLRGDLDFLGYADAVTALRNGRGDCTEFAVVLAALARARGIPARIAVGMAYSSRFTGRHDAFGPHAWVQVYDGTRWTSYDAGLEGFDSTHVAVAVGTGDPHEVFAAFTQMHRLRMEKVGRVAAPP